MRVRGNRGKHMTRRDHTLYSLCHQRGELTAIHRHQPGYTALMLCDEYLRPSAHVPVACTADSLLLPLSFHSHGNRFHVRDARVAELPLP